MVRVELLPGLRAVAVLVDGVLYVQPCRTPQGTASRVRAALLRFRTFRQVP